MGGGGRGERERDRERERVPLEKIAIVLDSADERFEIQ